MAKSLVIVESPSKAKTINKYLGRDYKVIASVGHIKNLPKSKISIDFENNYEPTYETIPGKEKIIEEMKILAAETETVFIATDPDREGEAIASDIADVVKKKNKNIYRVLFEEITKKGIKQGIDNPIKIDNKLVSSQQARRVMDRILGYKVSPFLWKVVYYGLSAGRVQSVALRLICEREAEIRNFVPIEYWSILANFKDNAKDCLFQSKLVKKNDVTFKFNGEDPRLSNEKEADGILNDLPKKQFVVSDIATREVKRNPYPPYTTSSLQQDASVRLRMSPKRTMMLAQKLYEGVDVGEEGLVGLVTYMRTDSTRLSEDAISEARDFIKKNYGKEFLQNVAKHYSKKKATTQDAHEAIRPTSVLRTPQSLKKFLSPELLRLYDLIWKRFTACQMESSVSDQLTLTIITAKDSANGKEHNDYEFRTTETKIKFKGFLEVYSDQKDEDEEDEERFEIPPGIEVGDSVELMETLKNQHFTNPQPRFTESSLIKQLDALGIGRPSTYAFIVSTIINRTYVDLIERRLYATQLGETVNKLLTKYFEDIVNVKFTAEMEEELDKIAEGDLTYKKVLDDFYIPFDKDLRSLDKKTKEIKESLIEKTDITCPVCGKETSAKLIKKWGRNGQFLSCEKYPKCKCAMPLLEEQRENEELAEGIICPKCEAPMIVRAGKFGKFYGCSNYPKCDGIRPITLKIPCPKCKEGEVLARKSGKRKNEFYGCTRYPDCDFISNFKPVYQKCENCPSVDGLMYQKYSKKKGSFLECPECKSTKSLEENVEHELAEA